MVEGGVANKVCPFISEFSVHLCNCQSFQIHGSKKWFLQTSLPRSSQTFDWNVSNKSRVLGTHELLLFLHNLMALSWRPCGTLGFPDCREIRCLWSTAMENKLIFMMIYLYNQPRECHQIWPQIIIVPVLLWRKSLLSRPRVSALRARST